MRREALLLGACATLLMCSITRAQSVDPNWLPLDADQKTQIAIRSAQEHVQSLDGPSPTAGGPSNSKKVAATVSGDASSASSQFSYIWPIQRWGDAVTGAILAAAPFSDSNTPKPELGSVSALTAGVNARVDLGFLVIPGLTPQQQTAFSESFYSACDAYVREVFGPDYYYRVSAQTEIEDPGQLHAVSFVVSKDMPARSCDELTEPTKLKQLVEVLNQRIGQKNERAREGKKEPLVTLKDTWRDAARKAHATFEHLNGGNAAVLQHFGLSLLGNQHSYSYVDVAAPTKVLKSSKEGYGLAANYGVLFSEASLLFGFSYERPFKPGTGQQVCSPISSTASTTCSTANVGAPSRTVARIASAEMRWLPLPKFAIAPRFEYDTVSANLGVKLPVYFVADPKSILNGGLQVGWTKKDGLQGGVVIQKAFSFLD